MPLLLVLRKELRDRAVLVSVTCSVLILLCVAAGVLWEPMSQQFASLRDILPQGLLALIPGDDMSTSTGWVNAQIMSLTAPGALIMVAVISAVRGTVGEEDRGTLALLLGNGVSRSVFASAKFVAMLIHVLTTAVVLLCGLLAANSIWSLGISVNGLIASCVHALALAWFFGALAAWVGLASGQTRATSMTAFACAATAFVMAAFFPLSDALSGWERLSPWYYFSGANALSEGLDLAFLLLLLGLSVAFYLLALWSFRERDIAN